jgi:cytoskeletal protein CcmA (bactofilin family)
MNMKKSKQQSQTGTLIAEGITVKDNTLCGTGVVTIAGVLFGEVEVDGVVTVAGTGSVKGNTRATRILIAGAAEGNITAREVVHIQPSGSVSGDIVCVSLRVEEGGIFNGQCRTGPNLVR